ncbi:TATA-binding protein-associated factor MOT1 [Astathelohania contejeani]|uniref:TATA-binding protein-associated factor MOT1 n=1 Tax=Astathelohania contejeani TaxID=164912 RepID=A0ABQ7HXH2_9MICR|nr:TATA-binding protein-associated factor MOT1 [Thelohania contejeani]
MNQLEKLFNLLESNTSKNIKKAATRELTTNIKEYTPHIIYILRRLHRLLMRSSTDERKYGAMVLRALEIPIVIPHFPVTQAKVNGELLASSGEEYSEATADIRAQRAELRKRLGEDHTGLAEKIVTEQDLKPEMSRREQIAQKRKQRENRTTKTMKIIEPESISEFVCLLTDNLVSPRWESRHGALLGLCALAEGGSAAPEKAQAVLPCTLIGTILRIFYEDKFNDYTADQTSAPVREAAAFLLNLLFPFTTKEALIDALLNLLRHSDWQTQFSGLIALRQVKNYIPENQLPSIAKLLTDLLDSFDEDVKYLAAELLSWPLVYADKNLVLSKCWENISNEDQLALGKTGMLTLVRECGIGKNAQIDKVYGCLRSPIPEVRKSALLLIGDYAHDKNMNEILNLLFLNLMVEEDPEFVSLNKTIIKKILNIKTHTDHNNAINDITMKLIYCLTNEILHKDDFILYDEHWFTQSGITLIGKDRNLEGRIRVMECIPSGFSGITSPDSLFGIVVSFLYDLARGCTDPSIVCFDSFLSMLPQSEVKKKQTNYSYISLHPGINETFQNITRAKAICEVMEGKKYDNIKNFYLYDTNEYLIIFISKMLIGKKYEFLNDLIMFLYKNERYLFFRVLKDSLFDYPSFNLIKRDKGRMEFFGRTIEYYDDLSKIEFIFEEAVDYLVSKSVIGNEINDTANDKIISNKIDGILGDNILGDNILNNEMTNLFNILPPHIPILQKFICSISYAEKFVSTLLDNKLSSPVINTLLYLVDILDPSFNVLFVNPLLRLINSRSPESNDAQALLSQIIPTLSLSINPKIESNIKNRIIESKAVLDQLIDITLLKKYKLECPTSLKLRDYQIRGVEWISMLFSVGVNGILADDMGLGKTVQVLSYVCNEIYKNRNDLNSNNRCLILCPSSLTGHWLYEIEKFFPFIEAMIPLKKKKGERFINPNCNIIISSYEAYRMDYHLFKGTWKFLIIDEGHVLRNRETILYQRILHLNSLHTLILTGTPVHNTVDDLYSLFNIAMPNFLGSEKEFARKYIKPIKNYGPECEDRLNELHKKVLPFILRRLKSDVLKDLPPKIITDLVVEMEENEKAVYEYVEEGVKDVKDEVGYGKDSNALKRMHDLLRVCSHPSFVTTYSEIDTSNIYGAKLQALEDLLTLLGGSEMTRKVLIFCQQKATIAFLIRKIKEKFPSLLFDKLDGSTKDRSAVVRSFNTTATSILFLTTQVGGLGLNLSTADTVIFYEHDWNPFNDLQAMDRAHRIGQKSTVNVYRLICKNTIEEKVMNLQAFKVHVAGSLVSQQNSMVESMDTKDLLERIGGNN